MCLLLLAFKQHPKYPLVIAANREEYYARPTRAAHFWEDAPQVLAGRDLLQGGTWLGITRSGRFAALTNFRDPETKHDDRPSRGYIVSEFLTGNETPEKYLRGVAARADQYNGFSVVVGHVDTLYYYSNREHDLRRLDPGIYGLSNHVLDTPWPKVVGGKQLLTRLLTESDDLPAQDLFALLADCVPAPDSALPETGVGLGAERWLSPIFVSGTDYGTRSSTVLKIDVANTVTFIERTFERKPDSYETVEHDFQIAVGRSAQML